MVFVVLGFVGGGVWLVCLVCLLFVGVLLFVCLFECVVVFVFSLKAQPLFAGVLFRLHKSENI